MNHHRPRIAKTQPAHPSRFFHDPTHRRRTPSAFALFVALALLLAAPVSVQAQPRQPDPAPPAAPLLRPPDPSPSPTPARRNDDAGVIRGILPVAGRTTGHFPSHTSTGGATMTTTTIERRLTPWFDALNLAIKRIDERPDHPSGEVVYVLKDLFTTRDGSWEPSEQPYAAPDWARAAYLDPGVFTKAFERTNLYAAVLDEAGNFMHGHPILNWSDGFERLGDPGYDGFVRQNAWEAPGWSTMVMYGSSSYAPGSGQSGPWCWMPAEVAAEVVCGGGLPDGEAVSIFAVWQAVRAGDPTPEPTPDPTPEPTPDPTPEPTPDPTPEPTPRRPPRRRHRHPTPDPTPEPEIVVERRLGRWFEDMNFSIRSIAERPDHPVQGDYIYVIKDVFTTLNGSWENMGDELGTVEAWARDAYLKPFHAPDYFDDAGADHHLFSAVIGLDGQFLRNFPMRYWSDGFAMLGDPEYQNYAYHLTKERSGWANLVMLSGSSYAPNRGESGPWCWTPAEGAGEVMCGGGMPWNHHISTFVVWQMIPRPQEPEPTPDPLPQPGGFNVFLPFVRGGAPAARGLTTPAADAPPPSDASQFSLEGIRAAARAQIGSPHPADSPLAAYALQTGLGVPITGVFTLYDHYIQGYQSGIVLAPVAVPTMASHIGWE
jgi:hypothetical protein